MTAISAAAKGNTFFISSFPQGDLPLPL